MERVPALPRNTVCGLALGVAVGLVAWLVAPAGSASFYSAIVQILPVFLVALALGRSPVETLGTEASVLAEQIARVRSDWTPPSRVTRTHYSIAGQLGQLRPQSISPRRFKQLARHYEDAAESDIWRSLAGSEQPSSKQLAAIAEVLVYRRLLHGATPRRLHRRMVASEDLVAEWEQLSRAFPERSADRVESEIRFRASQRYRHGIAELRRSVLFSISVLGTAEVLAFVGLLSPGQRYAGLFAATCGFGAASFLTVLLGAIASLLERPLDVQSAALAWSAEPLDEALRNGP